MRSISKPCKANASPAYISPERRWILMVSTGGFNFQNAWTTGWLAGRAAAQQLEEI